jgi:hypothetical protein
LENVDKTSVCSSCLWIKSAKINSCSIWCSKIIISLQTNNLDLLEKTIESNIDKVRFGAEFCDQRIPTIESLEKAFDLAANMKKDFSYVTPRLSNSKIETVKNHLAFLNEKKQESNVITNDLGLFSLLENHYYLKPHLGRQLVYIPSRSPWNQITEQKLGLLSARRIAKIFYQTSLNYNSTIQFFQNLGVKRVDVDWIPKSFPSFSKLARNGILLSIHLFNILVTTTRKCHTARFVGEEKPEECSRQCMTKSFLLKNRILNLDLILVGNTIFRLENPARKDIQKIRNMIAEIVIDLNPLVKNRGIKEISRIITDLKT